MFRIDSTVDLFTRAPDSWSLQQAWKFSGDELSRNARGAVHLLATQSDLRAQEDQLAWAHQAILEFQDLQGITVPREGRCGSINYLFYEGVSTLREAVLSGLNGCVHVSLSSMRTFMEMLLFHVWWGQKLADSGSHESFFEWLAGKERKRYKYFKEAKKEVFAKLPWSDSGERESRFCEVYNRLCSYVHKPLLAESITMLRGGNTAAPDLHVLSFWLSLMKDAADQCVQLLFGSKPISLFRLAPLRKFGFNVPVGVFPDESNHHVFERLLGSEAMTNLQCETANAVTLLLKQYDELPDLTDEQILKTWVHAPLGEEACRNDRERILLRAATMKADLRASNWRFAYIAPFFVDFIVDA